MTALSASRLATQCTLNAGDRIHGPLVATSETVYPGGLVMLDAGEAKAAAAAGTAHVAGFCIDEEPKVAGERCRVQEGICGPWAQTGATITAAHVGRRAYIADDQTLTLSTGGASFPRCAGIIEEVTSAGVWIRTGHALCAMLDQNRDVQTGEGALVAGVLTVSTGVRLSANSVISAVRVSDGGTEGDELVAFAADQTVGESGTAELVIKSMLDGAAATSDTSTIRWTVVG